MLVSSSHFHQGRVATLGYFHFQGFQQIANAQTINGLPFISINGNHVCKGCLQGKLHRKQFPKKSHTTTNEVLELVHGDVCGPFKVKSLGLTPYFVTFINNFSRQTWTCLMKHKSEALSQFKKLKIEVESILRKKIKCLCINNGGEYISREFSKYLVAAGIAHQLTQPRMPQQNGKVE
jgi:transposase InsO family protein